MTEKIVSHRMTNQQLSDHIDQQLKLFRAEMGADMKLLSVKVSALPDKSQIYTASVAVHGIIWATIIGVIIVLSNFQLISIG